MTTSLIFPSNPNIGDSYKKGNTTWVWGGEYWTVNDRSDIAFLNMPNRFVNVQNFLGTSTALSSLFTNISEITTLVSGAPAPTVKFYTATQARMFFTSPAVSNWSINFTHSENVLLDAVMDAGESIKCTLMISQGNTPFLPIAVTVDGYETTPLWANGSPPSVGHANAVDVFNFELIKETAEYFVVLASASWYF